MSQGVSSLKKLMLMIDTKRLPIQNEPPEPSQLAEPSLRCAVLLPLSCWMFGEDPDKTWTIGWINDDKLDRIGWILLLAMGNDGDDL